MPELQAPRAWYDMLLRFLISQHFSKGVVDPTLFTRKAGNDLLLAKPTEKHLNAVKWIFQYLKETINMGLWYLKDTGMSLTSYAHTDHAGCQDTRRSTLRSAQFLDKVMLIKLKWIYKVKTDEFGGVLKNKARPVAQGFKKDEGIDFEE
nr:uncharacterized mitochondrial protein AtMg00810-like [Tanacetum cinerariifolium]